MSLRRSDFLRRAPLPITGWILLAAGVVALGAALWLEHRWAGQRAAQQAQAARQAAWVLAQQKAAQPLPPTAADRRAQQAQHELNRPWLPAMRAIESATIDPVYLLAWNFDRGSGLVRLDGEAPSFEHALAYALRLDGEGPLTGATLVSHEPVQDPASGRKSVRFTVTTRWGAP